jgi:PTH2 family peptidyl-tRNA hydrolase
MSKTTKQVIVVRKDLNMRKGKIAAQVAHASMKVLLDIAKKQQDTHNVKFDTCSTNRKRIIFEYEKDSAWDVWINGNFAKICVYVESEAALDEVYKKAIDSGLPAALVVDSGKTEFHGVPTKTCCAIGPAWKEEIDLITGNLSLL